MATASVERERKRIRSRARMEQARPANDAAPISIKPKRAEPERKPGLRWMLGKGKITKAMCDAGERYALGVRVASCVDAAAVKSCMASLEGGRGGGGATFRTRSPEELEAAEWVAEYKRQTVFIRTRLFHDMDLMGVLDSISIRQLTPREITPHQREAEDIEAVAWTVLKLLVSILREYDNPPQVSDGQLTCAA